MLLQLLFFTLLFFTVYVIERRTMWISVLLLMWLASFSVYLIITLEVHHQSIGLAIVLAIIIILVLGLPFYILSFIWLLISSGIQLIKREGRRFHNFLSIALGLFIIGWAIISPFIRFPEEENFWWMLYSIISLTVYYFFFMLILFALASVLNRVRIPFKTYDYIIVLGSGLIGGNQVPPLLASRIDKGIDLFIRHHTKERPVKVIFTGGQGGDEKLPEGVAMAGYAKQKGLLPEHIIVEDEAVNTYENLLFSKRLVEEDMKARKVNHKVNVVTVTNNFHVFRALLWARKVKLKSDGVGSKTKFYFWLNALIREFIGVVYMQRKAHFLVLSFLYVVIISLALIYYFLLGESIS